jgi:hypothetical protein
MNCDPTKAKVLGKANGIKSQKPKAKSQKPKAKKTIRPTKVNIVIPTEHSDEESKSPCFINAYNVKTSLN